MHAFDLVTHKRGSKLNHHPHVARSREQTYRWTVVSLQWPMHTRSRSGKEGANKAEETPGI